MTTYQHINALVAFATQAPNEDSEHKGGVSFVSVCTSFICMCKADKCLILFTFLTVVLSIHILVSCQLEFG